MIAQQKQMLETFVRVRAFVAAHPVAGPLSYTGGRETLDEAVLRLREYAGAQITGRELGRAELRRQAQLIKQLFDRHMRPIVAIARAQIEPESDVRMPAALRLPRLTLGVTKLLQACDGMIEGTRPFEAVFIAHGLPADFLARFISARNALETLLGDRATLIGTQVGARTGLQVQLRRGSRAVERLDSVVRASLEGDEVALARWRSAKRVQKVPGGSAARGAAEVQEAEVPEAEVPKAA